MRCIRILAMAAAAAILPCAACGDSGNDNGAAKTPKTTLTTATALTTTTSATNQAAVAAVEKEFAIALTPSTAPGGSLVFNISNQGTIEHEFVIFRTDLAPEKLPTKSDGTVDEDGAGVTHVTEKEHVAPGTSTTLSATLSPGAYVMICNLPGHYAGGMHTGFTVT